MNDETETKETETSDQESGDQVSGDQESGETESGETNSLAEQVREALKGVIDPELGLNIVDLGLIYDVEVEDGLATVTMTLTSPGCPAGGMIMSSAQEAARGTEGVNDADVRLVWKPFWTPDRIDPDVRAALGF
ncbi:MAG: metal-sulfur cluster assembly factor [Gemmatimonadota bacterium]